MNPSKSSPLLGAGYLLAAAAAAGAGLMFLLDPVSGRHRRARITEKGIHARNVGLRYVGKKGRHLRNRAIGLTHRLGARFTSRAA